MAGADLPSLLASAASPSGKAAQRTAGGDGAGLVEALLESLLLADSETPPEEQPDAGRQASQVRQSSRIHEEEKKDEQAPLSGIVTPAFFIFESFQAPEAAPPAPAVSRDIDGASAMPAPESTSDLRGSSPCHETPSCEKITRDVALPPREPSSLASRPLLPHTEIAAGVMAEAAPQTAQPAPAQTNDVPSSNGVPSTESYPEHPADSSIRKAEPAPHSGSEDAAAPRPGRFLPDAANIEARLPAAPALVANDGSRQSQEAPVQLEMAEREANSADAAEHGSSRGALVEGPSFAGKNGVPRLSKAGMDDRNALKVADARVESRVENRSPRMAELPSGDAAGSSGAEENSSPRTEAADPAGGRARGAAPRHEIEPHLAGWVSVAETESGAGHAGNRATATTAAHQTAEPASLEQPAESAPEQLPRRLFLSVEGGEGRRVDIRVLQAAGHLSVRMSSLEADLSQRLRTEIRQLEQALRTSGWRAEVGVTEGELTGMAAENAGPALDARSDPGRGKPPYENPDLRSSTDGRGRESDRKGTELKEEFRDLSAIRRLRKGGFRHS